MGNESKEEKFWEKVEKFLPYLRSGSPASD
jgi:hypothetical protein